MCSRQAAKPSVSRAKVSWMPYTENKDIWEICSPVNALAWLTEARASKPSSPWQVINSYTSANILCLHGKPCVSKASRTHSGISGHAPRRLPRCLHVCAEEDDDDDLFKEFGVEDLDNKDGTEAEQPPPDVGIICRVHVSIIADISSPPAQPRRHFVGRPSAVKDCALHGTLPESSGR